MADAPVWDVSYFRHIATSSVSLHHGPALAVAESVIATISQGAMDAFPYPTGHGGTLIGGTAHIGGVGSQTLRLALYARTDANNHYPGQLIADLGSVACGSAFLTWSCAAVVTTPHDLIWLAVATNSDRTINCDVGVDTLVFGRSRTDFSTLPCALTYAQPVSSCWTTTFPASATVSGVNNAVYRIGLTYGAIP